MFCSDRHCWPRHLEKRVPTSIQARQGLAFTVMSHLAHIYSIPYRQDSELHFSRPAESYATVSVAHWYQLTFRRDPAGPVLVKCEYLEVEGD